jgi:nucleotide-binding universal stress UspA family protein
MAAPIVICFDGSHEATETITFVAGLVPGAPVLVVTVWKPIIEEALAGAGTAPPIADPAEANQRAARAAKQLASDGARRATEAGLQAQARAVKASDAVWKAIEETAREVSARLIACGTTRSGLMYALPGSVANALVQQAARPVLVVPSGKAQAERRRRFEKD